MSNHGNTLRSVDVTEPNSRNFPIADQSRRNRRLQSCAHDPKKPAVASSGGRENARQLPPSNFRETSGMNDSSNRRDALRPRGGDRKGSVNSYFVSLPPLFSSYLIRGIEELISFLPILSKNFDRANFLE